MILSELFFANSELFKISNSLKINFNNFLLLNKVLITCLLINIKNVDNLLCIVAL